eukprot:Rmarinus@m.19919
MPFYWGTTVVFFDKSTRLRVRRLEIFVPTSGVLVADSSKRLATSTQSSVATKGDANSLRSPFSTSSTSIRSERLAWVHMPPWLPTIPTTCSQYDAPRVTCSQ